eukprot:863165-Alexandrium_andersonii.AAC.1
MPNTNSDRGHQPPQQCSRPERPAGDAAAKPDVGEVERCCRGEPMPLPRGAAADGMLESEEGALCARLPLPWRGGCGRSGCQSSEAAEGQKRSARAKGAEDPTRPRRDPRPAAEHGESWRQNASPGQGGRQLQRGSPRKGQHSRRRRPIR